ncbi:hypothetical protein HPB49_012191 [Dermacentor silvarum]|uniref:Uncharacterized protein n=1 Tax=Dermacentor silvarum TaxID=543639 RepID=A0ACB8C3I1_DERSI|nr:hypothetical protein HPB49_012191 [Dermacentor silvarum]
MAASNENVVDLSGSVIERFLDAVQQHPCVYDTKRMDDRDVDRKKNAWELIRLFAGLSTVEECLKLWKRLRDRYTRELKAIEQTKRSGSGYVSRRAWEFAESMAFYRDCGRPRNISKVFVSTYTDPNRYRFFGRSGIFGPFLGLLCADHGREAVARLWPPSNGMPHEYATDGMDMPPEEYDDATEWISAIKMEKTANCGRKS